MPLIDPKILAELRNAAQRNELVIFMGAGISKNNELRPELPELPDWKELIHKLKASINDSQRWDPKERADIEQMSDDDPTVDTLLDYIKNNDKYCFQHAFWRIFSPDFEKHYPTRASKLVVGLKTNKLITTNYDFCLEVTAKELNCNWAHLSYRGIDIEKFKQINEETLKIVHIHGTAADRIDDIILTESQYEEAYFDNSNLRKFLDFIFENFVVLIIGFSFTDREIRKVFTRYSVHGKNTLHHSHYIILERDQKLEKTYTDIMRDNYNLKAIYYDRSNHNDRHSQLILLLEEFVNLLKRPQGFTEDGNAMSNLPTSAR